MDLNEFDERFRELYTAMVEIAFDAVGRDRDEVQEIFVFGSMEAGDFYYKALFKINGQVVKMPDINSVSRLQCDVSRDSQIALMRAGVRLLKSTSALFKEDKREVPTLMKMSYQPGTGRFDNEISYDLHYSNDSRKIVTHAYDAWFIELGGKPPMIS